MCLLDEQHRESVPTQLSGFHIFSWPNDDSSMCQWAGNEDYPDGQASGVQSPSWPPRLTGFRRKTVDRDDVFDFAARMLAGQSPERIILIRARSNHGKSTLLSELVEYAYPILPHALVDLKGCPTADEVVREINGELRRVTGYRISQKPGDVIAGLEELGAKTPVVLFFDTYEQCSDELRRTIETTWLGSVRRSAGLCFIVSGQEIPQDWKKHHWAKWVRQFELGPLERPADWQSWAKDRHPELTDHHIEALVVGLQGNPGHVASALESLGAVLKTGQR